MVNSTLSKDAFRRRRSMTLDRPRVGGNQRVINDLGQRCFCAVWVGIYTSRFGVLRSGDRTDTTWRVIC